MELHALFAPALLQLGLQSLIARIVIKIRDIFKMESPVSTALLSYFQQARPQSMAAGALQPITGILSQATAYAIGLKDTSFMQVAA